MKRDQILINQICNRDQQAFAELYDSYQLLLWRLVTRTVSCPISCEVIIQETFTYIWQYPENFHSSERVSTLIILTLKDQINLHKDSSEQYSQPVFPA